MLVPTVIIPGDEIKTIDQLCIFAEEKAKKVITTIGHHNPTLVGKMPDGSITISMLDMFELPQQQKAMADSVKMMLKSMNINMCCFIMETYCLEVDSDSDGLKEIEDYKAGKFALQDHPSTKHKLQFFVQRPGALRLILYDVITKEGVVTLENRDELKDPTGMNFFDFYKDVRVN